MSTPSKIFTGYRALGCVSNHVPLAVRHHHKHKENYVVTCIGKAFHTYNCSKLGIVSISNSHPGNISCLAVDKNLVYTGCGKTIRAFSRGKQVIHVYEGHKREVHLLLPFGSHLISVDVDSCIIVWDISTEGVYMEMQFDNRTFEVTAIAHPNTYLNKIILGSKQGRLQLWNIKSNKLLYTFPGWGVPVIVLEQAPAVDVLAVGLADGQIIVHNIKYDETVVKFRQEWGPVTTISFRTDGHPVMVTGSAAGHVALWDLEKRKMQSQILEAHGTTVTGMQCLPSEPLMVTSAGDNSLKVWIFDQSDGGGRLLRQRSGHSAPPNKLRHYGKNGQNIVSAGQDSTLRSFSVVHDKHHKSLGRASFNKTETKKSGLKQDQHMMPPIMDLASEASRQSDWDNIVACHRGLRVVTTWSYQRSTMGQHRLDHDRFKLSESEYKGTIAHCVDISSCGNFAVIGYSSGHVDIHNLQSGICRGSYGNPKAHTCALRGVSINGLNQVTLTAGADGEIKFWHFKRKTLLDTLKLDEGIGQIILHRESSMLAVSLDDFSIMMVDIDTRRVVRTFDGHNNQVTDMTFSPDARWLVTSSMDSTIKTWDLPTGKLIDCFLLDVAVTSLSMSPTGDFLTTSHVDDVGVYLWSNKTLYCHVPLKPLPSNYEPTLMEMPSTTSTSQGPMVETDVEQEYELTLFKSPEQIADELVTLSLLPESRWRNLLNLDVIKRRNKPKEPVRAPKSAPFFLSTIPGLELKFAAPNSDDADKKSLSHILSGSLQPLSDLGRMLEEAANDSSFDGILEWFKELGPSSIDLQIRSLSPDGGGSIPIMCQYIKFISYSLGRKKNFEVVQAYLGLFLKIHGDIIACEASLTSELEKLALTQSVTWKSVQDMFTQSLCLISYLRTAVL